MNIVIIIQARMGSSRLPGKVLKPLAGEPLILRLIERVKAAENAGKIIIAVTNDTSDDELTKLCQDSGLTVFRGSKEDLLDRHYQAAKLYGADAVVKIPSDCPLIDPAVIDKVLQYYLDHSNEYDYVSNLHPATYPDGNDVEIMSMDSLEKAWLQASKSYEREHTTPYFWENSDIFRIGNVTWENGLDYSMTHRFTIDYEQDYVFIKKVYDELYPQNHLFSMYDILSLLERQPEIKKINEHFAGVNWYRNHIAELKTVSPSQTRTI